MYLVLIVIMAIVICFLLEYRTRLKSRLTDHEFYREIRTADYVFVKVGNNNFYSVKHRSGEPGETYNQQDIDCWLARKDAVVVVFDKKKRPLRSNREGVNRHA